MSGLLTAQLISCDEAGFTGNNLLNPEQPFFSYASHDLSLREAEDLIRRVRAKHSPQIPELKAAKLLKSARGRKLILDVLDALSGRYIVTLYDKRYSLAAKLFEYLYEPVLQSNNALFYRHKVHQFVAMFFFMLMRDKSIEGLAGEFEAFMRSLDPADAPTLFGSQVGANPMIGQILRFVRGYNVIIAQEIRDLGRSKSGKWILDLTGAAVSSHLASWGQRHPLIEVVCDDSKPLRALSGLHDVMVNRPDIVHVEMFGKRRALTWNMSKPLAFASSAAHAGVQLADMLAGITAAVPGGGRELADHGQRLEGHFHDDCVLPDFDIMDLESDEAPVCWFVLEELATRAENGEDPLEGMETVFAFAKASLPQFRRFQMENRRTAGSASSSKSRPIDFALNLFFIRSAGQARPMEPPGTRRVQGWSSDWRNLSEARRCARTGLSSRRLADVSERWLPRRIFLP